VKGLQKTRIEWADRVWNPIVGCRNHCSYCYAEALCKRFQKPWGLDPDDPFKPIFLPERLEAPLKLEKPSKIFMMSMGELWGSWVPYKWKDQILGVVGEAHQHTFLNLTKNPNGMLNYQRKYPMDFPENMWIGVSVDTMAGTSRILELRQVYAPGRKFVSFEPLLENVAMGRDYSLEGIDWVIIGALSKGREKVQPDPTWTMNIVADCIMRDIPIFMKDNLRWAPGKKGMLQFPEGFP